MSHRFPSPPGPQHDYEPPRIQLGVVNRADRIKALGNAVVPQVAYPIFALLHEKLSTERRI